MVGPCDWRAGRRLGSDRGGLAEVGQHHPKGLLTPTLRRLGEKGLVKLTVFTKVPL